MSAALSAHHKLRSGTVTGRWAATSAAEGFPRVPARRQAGGLKAAARIRHAGRGLPIN
jgi:hypothetical protein